VSGEWPPRWTEPHFKTPISKKVVRGKKRAAAATVEKAKKLDVRTRDKTCRVPLCGCRKFNLALHVSHSQHKGMGGNPKGDRSAPELMVLVCSARHRENLVSIDRASLRWRPLTKDGANGPIAWDVDARCLKAGGGDYKRTWVEVARETAIRSWAPFTRDQKAILTKLSGMEL
jgi:hypothetical protein